MLRCILRFGFLLIALTFLFTSSETKAQQLTAAQIEQLFSNKTSFGHTNAGGKSWNAYWGADGRVTYWFSSQTIHQGTWLARDNLLCVQLDTLVCRIPLYRRDGMFDWFDPLSRKATSTLVRFQPGDVLRLRNRPHRSQYTPPPVLDGTAIRIAQTERWVQTNSTRTIAEARDLARALPDRGFEDHTVVAAARNGWYAVLIGTLSPSSYSSLDVWKSKGWIPSDSRLVSTLPFWQMERVAMQHSSPSIAQKPAPKQCTAEEYKDLKSACDLVFASEFACNRAFADDEELKELLARTPSSSVLCSAAAQLFFDHGIDPISLAISAAAGLSDEAADQAKSDGSASGKISGVFLDLLTAGISAAGVGYCYSTVDQKCGR